MDESRASQTPYRQIRAKHDENTVTVYQAYSAEIAIPAVKSQKLSASPSFSTTRMTWIKPSWAWMLYRSGYSYKDSRQTHILALTLSRQTFVSLLRTAMVHGNEAHDGNANLGAERRIKKERVRVQWDPERTVRLGKLPYRSIQIGVPGGLVDEFMEGIVRIEDVTEKARKLKSVLDEDVKTKLGMEDLKRMELSPEETEVEIDDELRKILRMDVNEEVS
ncbi:ATP-dependent RNA helicase DHX8 [Trematosphaeria pertusa]|uniref:ATP-dependent RNA helicase DHX8 n=1 Tax=Trematosphaeria pertusa TaxID=390896 RepID=A0A6A6I1P6_9PLEO|nr:ATP-dependent RNA helicase DHX8 [Trematosphaeria pertusa]KAF2244206.1 ATP-dependent RNA helicase DHX8 [Trematosphaeria pertusa]